MQFLDCPSSMKLKDLSDRVRSMNTPSVLNINSLKREPSIGQSFKKLCQQALDDTRGSVVEPARKQAILNRLVDDSDVFEYVALQSEDDWNVLNKLNTIRGMLKMPVDVRLPMASDVLGNGVSISADVYDAVMNSLEQTGSIDPAIFTAYSVIKPSQFITTYTASSSPIDLFNLPWGKISLYSSISDQMMDFPVFPEEYADSKVANYDTMGDIIYQYEPWVVYHSSGPRQDTFTFDMHRDMWTGDHKDGKCNELIRFCEANCYPEYNGSLVNTAIVTLYISGNPIITGVMTNVSTTWDGPIGHDDFPLHVRLAITIQEVATAPLNYDYVRNLPLIR